MRSTSSLQSAAVFARRSGSFTSRAHTTLRVMAGCMIETSLGISAIAQIAPLLDTADFDGAALLADDPFQGATISDGRVRLVDAPGLGVIRRPA